MARAASWSRAAFVTGALALACFLWLAYILRYPAPYAGYVLRFFADVGLVNTAPSYIAEVKPASILSFNDANAIVWLHWCAFSLAAIASMLALWTEWKRESNAYAAAGFIMGTAGMWLIAPVAGFGAQVLGAVALIVIRRSRRPVTPPGLGA